MSTLKIELQRRVHTARRTAQLSSTELRRRRYAVWMHFKRAIIYQTVIGLGSHNRLSDNETDQLVSAGASETLVSSTWQATNFTKVVMCTTAA